MLISSQLAAADTTNQPTNTMKTTLTTSKATHILLEDKYASWSKAGALALVMYLEELENDTKTEVEFCPVELRCGWTEYESLESWANEQFSSHVDGITELGLTLNDEGKIEQSEDEIDAVIREYIQDRNDLLEFHGGILVRSF